MLSPNQKSVYLIILNATMIARSLGRTFPLVNRKEKIRLYKQVTFRELDQLASKMDSGDLNREDIHAALRRIKAEIDISFGQAQKGLNVLLKYHYALYHLDNPIKCQLDCPLDKIILDSLQENISLINLSEHDYMRIQDKINGVPDLESRVDYDNLWDHQHLQDEGLI